MRVESLRKLVFDAAALTQLIGATGVWARRSTRATDLAFRWVRDGQRTITTDDVHEAVDHLDLRGGPVQGVLSVQAIDLDPLSDDATATLNWVDLYQGDSPALRRQLQDPASCARMQTALKAAAAALDAGRWRHLICRGFAREATWVAVGAALPGVRGYELAMVQNGRLWSTDAAPSNTGPLQQRASNPGLGNDLAVVIEVSAPVTTAVEGLHSRCRTAHRPTADAEPLRWYERPLGSRRG